MDVLGGRHALVTGGGSGIGAAIARALAEAGAAVTISGRDKTKLAALARAGAGEGGRRLVFVASTAALKGYPYVAAYVAAKHGVLGLSRALSAELAATGVTVNAVCPGFTDTPLLAASVDAITAKTKRSADDARAALAKDNAHNRLNTPQEVAGTVLRLCTAAAQSVNGQAVVIAGGQV